MFQGNLCGCWGALTPWWSNPGRLRPPPPEIAVLYRPVAAPAGRKNSCFGVGFPPKFGPVGWLMAQLMFKPFPRKALMGFAKGIEDYIETGKSSAKRAKIVQTCESALPQYVGAISPGEGSPPTIPMSASGQLSFALSAGCARPPSKRFRYRRIAFIMNSRKTRSRAVSRRSGCDRIQTSR